MTPDATRPRTLEWSACDVMGAMASITLVGGDAGSLLAAELRLRALEQRWSRFLPTSDVSRLNAAAGRWVAVDADTVILVERAVDGWRTTSGGFDPTVLAAVVGAGYVGDLRTSTPRPGKPGPPGVGMAGVEVDRTTGQVRLPAGCGLDPGGIGKGLAADLVAFDLRRGGAPGGCVNVGGDLRAWGIAPHGGRWRVDLGDRTVEIAGGGIATSGSSRRRWEADGATFHHVVDSRTGRPTTSGTASVTVVATSGWRAECCATALMAVAPDAAPSAMARWGVEGIAVGDDDRRHPTASLAVRT
jgi:thiamine biosynthesis lipoprotein